MSLPSTPCFFCLHYFGPAMAHSHFSTSYTAHGFAIPFFPGFFKPICFLKAHLSIPWTCDPLFLSLGLNGFFFFFYPFTNSFIPVLLGFFLFGFPKTTVNTFSSLLSLHIVWRACPRTINTLTSSILFAMLARKYKI